MTPLRVAAYLWAGPVTAAGLALAAVARLTGGTVAGRGGVVEVTGGAAGWWLRRRGAAAAAVGHVVFARDPAALARSRRHESHHVRQYERYGVFALPAYAAVAGWLWLRGFHPYLDHPFEPPPGGKAGDPAGGPVDSA